MSLFELFLIYAVSWWLILFMVLPVGVRIPKDPGKGHAASAPHNPQLRKKLLATTLITFLVTLAIWGVDEARASSGIYHAGSNDCAEPADAPRDASINATDKDATIGGGIHDVGTVPTYLDSPVADHTDADRAKMIGAGVINTGVAETDTRTGEVRINGVPVGTAATTRPTHCK